MACATSKDVLEHSLARSLIGISSKSILSCLVFQTNKFDLDFTTLKEKKYFLKVQTAFKKTVEG